MHQISQSGHTDNIKIKRGVIIMLRPALFDNRTYKPMFFDDSFDKMFDNAFKNFWGNNELATFDGNSK